MLSQFPENVNIILTLCNLFFVVVQSIFLKYIMRAGGGTLPLQFLYIFYYMLNINAFFYIVKSCMRKSHTAFYLVISEIIISEFKVRYKLQLFRNMSPVYSCSHPISLVYTTSFSKVELIIFSNFYLLFFFLHRPDNSKHVACWNKY